MAILFIIPLGLTAMWLYAETKPDVLRRIIYGSLALLTLFIVTTLNLSWPKERDMRRMALARIEQRLRDGDTNAVLEAFATYRTSSRGKSDYGVNLQIVQTLGASGKEPAR